MDLLWQLEPLVLGAYTASMALLLLYALGQVHLGWLGSLGSRRTPPCPHRELESFPFVTVQLPVYNERHVIERLLRATAALDYPRDRLEIQVLDDSDDATTRLAARAARRLAREGLQVHHVRRGDRGGYKAGALAHGMRSARGDFIAIFDADFVPRPDFLRRALPCFSDPRVAVVQTRWAHLNEYVSLMTRVEAFFLALHFGYEQPRREAAGLFLNFNGTCGVWRAAAISDAGGWQSRTITEDIDLSYRAQMKGWRIRYLDDYETPGELPEEMSGFRTQQHRWMKGGAQNAALHLRAVIASGLPRRVRWHGVHHLLGGSVYLLILFALLLSTPLALLKNRVIAVEYVDFGMLFLVSTGALFFVFHVAQRPRPRGIAQNLRFAGMMVLFLVFTMGLSVHNGLAVLSGWLGRPGAFVRTPKYGARRWERSGYAGRTLDRTLALELAMLAYLGVGLLIGWQRQEFAWYPLQIMACCGLAWVASLSFLHPLRARLALRPRRRSLENKEVIA